MLSGAHPLHGLTNVLIAPTLVTTSNKTSRIVQETVENSLAAVKNEHAPNAQSMHFTFYLKNKTTI